MKKATFEIISTNSNPKAGLVVGSGAKVLMEAAKNHKANAIKLRIAKMILEAIKANKWTQVDLAKKLGVSKQAVNKYISGNMNFTIEQLVKLELILNKSLITDSVFDTEQLRNEFGLSPYSGERPLMVKVPTTLKIYDAPFFDNSDFAQIDFSNLSGKSLSPRNHLTQTIAYK